MLSLSEYLTLIVTITNLAAIPTIQFAFSKSLYLDAILIFFAMFGSLLHHISARNRGLEPVLFAKYSGELLWLDRIAAVMAISRILYIVYTYNIYSKASIDEYLLVFVTLSCLFYSDVILKFNVIFTDKLKYTAIHSLWHICAFVSAKQVLTYV